MSDMPSEILGSMPEGTLADVRVQERIAGRLLDVERGRIVPTERERLLQELRDSLVSLTALRVPRNAMPQAWTILQRAEHRFEEAAFAIAALLRAPRARFDGEDVQPFFDWFSSGSDGPPTNEQCATWLNARLDAKQEAPHE